MIFVTGGTGLLGSHILLELVISVKKVRALKRRESSIANTENTFGYYSENAEELFQKIEWVDGDVCDIYSLLVGMNDCDQVIHAAAIVDFNPNQRDEILKINIEGTTNVVNACLETKIKKFCYISSIAALGKNIDGTEITEITVWKQTPDVSNYSVSKHFSEREVWRGIEEGLNAVIVNPSVIIGPGNWTGLSGNFLVKAFKGLKYYTEGMTGFVDVRDVAKISVQLLESEIKSERFILNSENRTFKEFYDIANPPFGKKKPSKKATIFLAEIFWRLEKIRSVISHSNPLLTKETARAAFEKRKYSNQKIKSFLNCNFLPVDESIRHTAKMFLKDMGIEK
jgi:dihydroflavonol-4-reductase